MLQSSDNFKAKNKPKEFSLKQKEKDTNPSLLFFAGPLKTDRILSPYQKEKKEKKSCLNKQQMPSKLTA